MKKTFIINGRFLTQKLTGVHRYAFEICCALHQLGFEFILLSPQNILSNYDCPFEVIKIGKFSSHIWEQLELPYYINRHYKDSVLINFTGLGTLLHKNNISTIHDLSFLENPAWFSFWYYHFYKFLTPLIAKKAIKIITVSEFSKKELIDKLNIKEEKISVVYNAVSDKLINSKSVSNESYILSVSSIDPRKNFIRLIEAYNLLKNKSYKLIIVGKKNKIFRDFDVKTQHNNQIIFTGYVSDSELADLYRNATIFVYPSLYEGFGIPNLEAMNNECPVITSRIPPHLEVCQDAALYFNPEDINDIAKQIDLVLDNSDLREKLIIKGKMQVQKFGWRESAKQILNIISTL